MKNLIGKEVTIGVNDSTNLKGILMADYPDKLVLKYIKEGKDIHCVIFKDKITLIATSAENNPLESIVETPANNPKTDIPLCMIACQNIPIKCPGVRCMVAKNKKEITKVDYELLMRPCPKRDASCRYGVIGNNIYDVPEKILISSLKDVVFGEYPAK